jgi:DNA-directed RNA polymerase specialized sigma24 family protein
MKLEDIQVGQRVRATVTLGNTVTPGVEGTVARVVTRRTLAHPVFVAFDNDPDGPDVPWPVAPEEIALVETTEDIFKDFLLELTAGVRSAYNLEGLQVSIGDAAARAAERMKSRS